MHYSGAGVQMVLIIGIFVFLGRKLDGHFMPSKPWWTLGLSLFGVIVALLYIVSAFNKISKK